MIFKDGGHPDGIGAEFLEHANFSRCFVLRSDRPGVNAFMQNDVDLGRGGAELFAQPRREGFG
jgi:hypothetical protein